MNGRFSYSRWLLAPIAFAFGCAFLGPKTANIPIASAHRALHASEIENSLPAIRAGVEAKIPLLEIDIRPSGGKMVLFHDRRLEPDNHLGPEALNGRLIVSLTADEVAQIRLPDGTPLPTFEEAIPITRGTGTRLELDIKADDLDFYFRVVEAARAQNALEDIVVQSWHAELVRALRERYPALSFVGICETPAEFEEMLLLRPEFLQSDENWFTKEYVDRVHAAGLKVLANSLNERDNPEQWERFRQKGVDVLMTDKIAEFYKWRESPR